MPVLSFECGKLSEKQKVDLIEKLSLVSSQVTGIPQESFIVLIKEIPDENVGVGGVPLPEIKALRET